MEVYKHDGSMGISMEPIMLLGTRDTEYTKITPLFADSWLAKDSIDIIIGLSPAATHRFDTVHVCISSCVHYAHQRISRPRYELHAQKENSPFLYTERHIISKFNKNETEF